MFSVDMHHVDEYHHSGISLLLISVNYVSLTFLLWCFRVLTYGLVIYTLKNLYVLIV